MNSGILLKDYKDLLIPLENKKVKTPSPVGDYLALNYAWVNGCPRNIYLMRAKITIQELFFLLNLGIQIGEIEPEGGFDRPEASDVDWDVWNPLDHLPGGKPTKNRTSTAKCKRCGIKYERFTVKGLYCKPCKKENALEKGRIRREKKKKSKLKILFRRSENRNS